MTLRTQFWRHPAEAMIDRADKAIRAYWAVVSDKAILPVFRDMAREAAISEITEAGYSRSDAERWLTKRRR